MSRWGSGPRWITHNGVTPELCHLVDPHGRQQGFPDFKLEHVPHDDIHGLAHLLAVVYHRALLVAFCGAEMKGHLATKRVDPSLHTSQVPKEAPTATDPQGGPQMSARPHLIS